MDGSAVPDPEASIASYVDRTLFGLGQPFARDHSSRLNRPVRAWGSLGEPLLNRSGNVSATLKGRYFTGRVLSGKGINRRLATSAQSTKSITVVATDCHGGDRSI